MRKRRILAVLLCAALAVPAWMPVFGTAAATPPEVTVAKNLKEYRKAAEEPDPERVKGLEAFQYRELLLFLEEGALKDSCGAANVLYYQPLGEYVLQYETPAETEAAYRSLVKKFGREKVMPNLPVKAQWVQEESTRTPAASVSWGNDAMMLDALRDKANSAPPSGKVIVAVLDSGVRPTHELLEGRISADSVAMPGYKSAKSPAYSDDNGHGTHVAGIIADGTSKQVEILAIKTADQSGKGTFNSMLMALEYAAKRGAKVINMSFGADRTNYGSGLTETQLQSILDSCEMWIENICQKYDCLAVVASGNSGRNIEENSIFPACFKGMITVGAVGAADFITPEYKPLTFSSYGTSVDFCGPGKNIVSAWKDKDDEYYSASGTSMAAPHVAAAAAMIRLYHPGMSRTEVEDVMRLCAEDVAPQGIDPYSGCGLITFRNGTVPSQIPLEGGNATLSVDVEGYTGKAHRPALTVTLRGRTLTEGKEYTISYSGNVRVGYCTVTAVGQGRYTGSLSARMRIIPKGTRITKVKKKGKRKLSVTWKKQKTQTTGYQIQVSTDKTFKKVLKTINVKAGKNKLTIRKLKKKKRYYLRIRTFKTVGKTAFLSNWSKTVSKKV